VAGTSLQGRMSIKVQLAATGHPGQDEATTVSERHRNVGASGTPHARMSDAV